MNAILRSARMPWTARIKGSREWLVGVVWLPIVVHGVLAAHVHNPLQVVGACLLLTGCATLWSVPPNALWLARDAQRLRLPSIEHDSDRVLPIYALLLVLLPACILGLVFGHALAWLLLLALVATSMLAGSLLPNWLVLPLFAILTTASIVGAWPFPAFGAPRFLLGSALAVALLGAAAAWRWSALRLVRCAAHGKLSLPTALSARIVKRHQLSGAALPIAAVHRNSSLRNVPRHIGPGYPVRAIEFVAVRTRRSALRRNALGVILVLALPVATAIGLHLYGTRATPSVLQQAMFWAGLVSVAVGRSFILGVDSFWRQRRADLSLLALLPGVSAHNAPASSALRACMRRPQHWGWGIAIACALAFAVLRAPWVFYVYLVLATVCGRMHDRALCAHILAGMPVRKPVREVLHFSTFIVAGVTAFWGIRAPGIGSNARLVTGGWPALACVALWIVTWIAFATLAWRGWRALQQRPHPFLATPR
ncbi:MAG TPA: hypothetical protein VF292_05490 [Rhodanobacteraceae bacterium]